MLARLTRSVRFGNSARSAVGNLAAFGSTISILARKPQFTRSTWQRSNQFVLRFSATVTPGTDGQAARRGMVSFRKLDTASL